MRLTRNLLPYDSKICRRRNLQNRREHRKRRDERTIYFIQIGPTPRIGSICCLDEVLQPTPAFFNNSDRPQFVAAPERLTVGIRAKLRLVRSEEHTSELQSHS